MMNKVSDVTEPELILCFSVGLTQEIQGELLMVGPKTLVDDFARTHVYESRYAIRNDTQSALGGVPIDEPMALGGEKVVLQNEHLVTMILVQWKGRPPEEKRLHGNRLMRL